MSGVALHHHPWTAHTVSNVGRGITSPPLDNTQGRQRRAWHDITALGLHIRSNDVGRGMTTRPLDSTHGRTKLGVECHHRLWAAQTVEQCRAWHAIIALGRQTRSNDVRHGMQTSPLGSTDRRTASGVACHHRLWAAHTVERGRALHAIIAFVQHTKSNDVWRGMPSSSLGITHGRTTSGVACHHRLWAAHTVERRRTWHAIITFGQNKRSNDVRRGMSPSLLD